jgi:aminopeptidase N
MTPSHFLSGNTYFALNYGKSEIALRLFKEYIGNNNFRSLMRAFINTWKYKHPTPYDFFAFTNDYLKIDLDWYWEKWAFSYSKPDLSIKELIKDNNSYSIVVENIGGSPLPIELSIEYTDGTKENISYKIDVWKTGEKALSINHVSRKEIKKIVLGNESIPDSNKGNNIYEPKR